MHSPSGIKSVTNSGEGLLIVRSFPRIIRSTESGNGLLGMVCKSTFQLCVGVLVLAGF